MKRAYLYLASRSKQNGIKVITVLQSEKDVNFNLQDLSTLQLPQLWERRIGQIIHENRMDYEVRMETSNDFNELRSKLTERGYVNVPVSVNPLLDMKAYAKAPKVDAGKNVGVKTMLRKAK